MTFDDIVEGLKALAAHSDAMSQVPSNHGLSIAYAKRANLFRAAAAALLQLHPDALSNEPLTLEELREMDGQPVWCQPDEGVGYWVLVTVRASKVVVRDQYGMTADVEVWMKRGERYYRRPPKEG